MTTTATALLPGWIGCRAYAADLVRVGQVRDVLFDVRSGAPAWLALELLHEQAPWALVPAVGLRHRVAGLQLAVTREQLARAPRAVLPPGELTRAHAAKLAAHYGVRCGGGPWRGVVEPATAAARVHQAA